MKIAVCIVVSTTVIIRGFMKVCQHGLNIYIIDQNVLKRTASQL